MHQSLPSASGTEVRVSPIAETLISDTSISESAIHDVPALSVIANESSVARIRRHFAARNKTVVTFFGYSGAGYEDPAEMLRAANRVLEAFDPHRTIVNIGATADGIGAVYGLAKRRGFTTTGIVSTLARDMHVSLAEGVDRVFYVDDATWGGFRPGTRTLSPTSRAMVAVSDWLFAIGGNEIARDELLGARRLGKRIRFIAADLNHKAARAAASKKGLPEPTSFRGSVSQHFPAESAGR